MKKVIENFAFLYWRPMSSSMGPIIIMTISQNTGNLKWENIPTISKRFFLYTHIIKNIKPLIEA